MASLFRTFSLARLRPAVTLAALLLQACASDEAPLPCPDVVRIVDASRMVGFEGFGRDLTDVRFEADLEEMRLSCAYDDAMLEVTLEVTMAVLRGPADRMRLAAIDYFVAITDEDRNILARETFDLKVPFEGNRTRILVTDEVTPRIPLGPGKTGADYLIYVGFSLTPEQLRYNRRVQ